MIRDLYYGAFEDDKSFYQSGFIVSFDPPRSEWSCTIGHFRVLLYLCFKASLSAKPFLWKLIFIWKVLHLDSFWNRGTRDLGNGLLYKITRILVDQRKRWIHFDKRIYRLQMRHKWRLVYIIWSKYLRLWVLRKSLLIFHGCLSRILWHRCHTFAGIQ